MWCSSKCSEILGRNNDVESPDIRNPDGRVDSQSICVWKINLQNSCPTQNGKIQNDQIVKAIRRDIEQGANFVYV